MHFTELEQIITQGKKYQVIYCDPPWSYDNKQHAGAGTETTGAHLHYPTMPLDEICELPIASIADKDCLCYMWNSGAVFADSLKVMSAWGFQYATTAFVWEKQVPNPGFYTMSSCEFVIVGKKGKIPQPRGSRNERQFLSKQRTVHSEKPDEIRERITRMHPANTKIELFARHNISGWDTFGNQTGLLDKVLPTDLFENFYR